MHFAIDPADTALRIEIRAYLEAEVPEDISRRGARDYHSTREDVRRIMQILDRRGWSAPHWPVADGGTGWTPAQLHLFEEELQRLCVPTLDRVGVNLIGPVLCQFGSQEQKARFLPAIRNGEHWWCQGFSEPGAGSDLANLKTRAERDGDVWVVNGQKTWTTEAHYADWMFALVRTDPNVRPQAGLTFLLIDMKSPGVIVRPIWSIDKAHTLNEVFLDDVRVPAENVVGEAGQGWTYAKFLLKNERTSSAEAPHTKRDLQQLKRLADRRDASGQALIDDPIFRRQIAEFELDLLALDWAVMRVLHEPANVELSAVAATLKLRGAELRQRVADLQAEALGLYGLAACPDPEGEEPYWPTRLAPAMPEDGVGVTAKAMFRRATTIYGGSNEIQREIISKSILGLP